MTIPRILPLLFIAASVSSVIAQSSLVVTYAEGPDDVNSRLNGTSVFTFNELTPGQTFADVEWAGVGTFDRLHVLSADAYGGAVDPGFSGGSPYSVQAEFAGVTSTNIMLLAPHAYFGFWWSAGDASNIIEFYRGDQLVSSFTTATLLDRLSTTNEYRGNPKDRGINYGENYAFINFFGQGGANWDRIVLSNGPGSGFESDNYTDRARAWSYEEDGPMPGHQLLVINTPTTSVPEAGASVLGMMGAALLLLKRRDRRA